MSPLEDILAFQLRAAGLPAPERELAFAKPRRWRFDLAWPTLGLAMEVDGGTWVNGRHSRAGGFEADCEKLSEAAIRGWRVLRVTADMVKDGRALKLAERALEEVRGMDDADRPAELQTAEIHALIAAATARDDLQP